MGQEFEYMTIALSILRALANDPDQVDITRTEDDRGVLLTVKAAKEDLPRLIGKGGATATALRTITRSIGMKSRARVSIVING